MKRPLLLTLFVVCVLATAVLAGNNPNAKLAIHVRVHATKNPCSVNITSCSDISTTEASDNFDAFPIFFDLVEYKGCSYSLTWPDWTYSAALTSCSDFVIGDITLPGPNQYAAHSWTTCQETDICIPGFVWLYADGPGLIYALDPSAPDLGLEVLDCESPNGGLDTPVKACKAGVSGESGDPDPCDCPPYNATLPTTWGEIKSLFR
jgi:hypothetical protein